MWVERWRSSPPAITIYFDLSGREKGNSVSQSHFAHGMGWMGGGLDLQRSFKRWQWSPTMVSTPAACVVFHRKEERCDVRSATRLEMVVESGPAAAALYSTLCTGLVVGA